MSKTALKPCPFCGHNMFGDTWEPTIPGYPVKAWAVACGGAGCGVVGPVKKSKSAATRAWNRRAEEMGNQPPSGGMSARGRGRERGDG